MIQRYFCIVLAETELVTALSEISDCLLGCSFVSSNRFLILDVMMDPGSLLSKGELLLLFVGEAASNICFILDVDPDLAISSLKASGELHLLLDSSEINDLLSGVLSSNLFFILAVTIFPGS
jgi:hypothetical protein